MIVFPLLASVIVLAHNGQDHTQITQTRPNAATKAAEFRENVRKITDEAKQKTVENLSQRLTTLNQTWVSHWESALGRLANILVKIETRATNLTEDGKDTSELMTAITNAKEEISQAQAIVAEQKIQDYTFTFTSEENLRADVQAHVAHFKADIRLAIAAVQDAREAVRLAFVELAQITGERVSVQKEINR